MTLDEAEDVLSKTYLIKANPLSGVPYPMPIPRLCAPMAHLMRRGGPGHRLEMTRLLAHRTLAVRERNSASRSMGAGRYRIDTEHGQIEFSIGKDSDISARLKLDEHVLVSANEVILLQTILPESMISACIGRRLGDVIETPRGLDMEDLMITKVNVGTRRSRLVLDVPQQDLWLADIPHDSQDSDPQPLALCA